MKNLTVVLRYAQTLKIVLYFFLLDYNCFLCCGEKEVNDSGKIVETFNHASWKGLLLVFWSKLLMDEPIYVILLRVLSS